MLTESDYCFRRPIIDGRLGIATADMARAHLLSSDQLGNKLAPKMHLFIQGEDWIYLNLRDWKGEEQRRFFRSQQRWTRVWFECGYRKAVDHIRSAGVDHLTIRRRVLERHFARPLTGARGEYHFNLAAAGIDPLQPKPCRNGRRVAGNRS